MFSKILSLLLIVIIVEVFARELKPVVKLPHGRVQGINLKTADGKVYEAYLGIPYARPPVGQLRFKEPQPVTKWPGTYNASSYGSDCLQLTHLGYSVVGSEDCLFINVYKPLGKKDTKGNLYDVIVHIHGGAFMFLSSKTFLPDKIINRKDVVYVSMNYRLGPLGFMSTGDKVLPGNLGMKDQTLALKWIKDNIQHFQGDPDKITITGLSAGGASVHYHLLSPLSRGLFSRAISASGCALNPWSFTEEVPKKTRVIAKLLGCPTTDSVELVECLNSRPAEQIVSQVRVFLKWLYNPYSPFGPTVEPEGTDSPFLPKHPYDIMKDKEATQVPWLVTFTTEEGLYPAAEFADNEELLTELENRWTELAPHILDFNFTLSLSKHNHVTDLITQHYLKGKGISEGRRELVQMIGDRLFGAGLVQSAVLQAAVSDKEKAPIYMYHFGYRGKFSVSELFSHSTTNLGVAHGDDIGYILDSELFHMDQTEEDRSMSNRMINLWLAFAKNGVPEFFDDTPLPIVQEGIPKLKYLKIRSEENAEVETVDDLAEFRFWSTLPIVEHLTLPSNLGLLKDEL